MKPVKILGLVLAALMAMAVVGAGSAMANPTALCKEDTDACPEEKVITHVHETTLAGKKAVLKTSILTIECDVLFLGDVTNAGGLSEGGEEKLDITGKEAKFVYTNCGSCTLTEENGPALLEVLREGHETASVTIESLLHSECSGLNCRYNEVGIKLTAKGSLLSTETNGSSVATEQSLNKESGLFCPSTTKLTITTTPLTVTYLNA